MSDLLKGLMYAAFVYGTGRSLYYEFTGRRMERPIHVSLLSICCTLYMLGWLLWLLVTRK